MRWWWLWTLALVACSGSPTSVVPVPPSAPAASPAAAEAPRYALVWANAFVSPNATTEGVKARMRSFADLDRPSHVGDVWPVEVLSELGDLVKVRSLGGEDAGHCYRGPSAFNALSVVLYVAREDLAAVVSEPISGAFADGSWVAVNPGVAVMDRTASADGLRMPLPAESEIGSTYVHQPRFDMRDVKQQTRTPVRVNGMVVAEDELTSVPLLGVDGTKARVLAGCLQAEGQTAEAPELAPYHAVDARDAASPKAPKSAKHFPIGTPLYLPDGTVVGETRDALALSLLETKGDLLCFQRSLSDHTPSEPMPEHHTLDLCVKGSAAREKPQPRATFVVPTQPPPKTP